MSTAGALCDTMRLMSELMAAASGLVGAAVGAAGAVWGAKLTTKSAIHQAVTQREHSDEQWAREQRQSAYAALLDVADQAPALEQDINVAVVSGGGMSEIIDRFVEFVHEIRAAAARVEICGPEQVRRAAVELRDASVDAMDAMTKSNTFDNEVTAEIMAALGRRTEAHDAFRVEASAALGFKD